jgi:hypothetical protein
MKKVSDALGNAENMSGSAKHENGKGRPRYRRIRVREDKICKREGTPSVPPRTSPHPRYRRKLVRARKTRKRDTTPSVPQKTCRGAQNIKMGPDALGTAKTSPGAQNKKIGHTPPVPPKMSLGAQNKKTGPDAPGTAENESGNAKQENGTRRPRYRRK